MGKKISRSLDELVVKENGENINIEECNEREVEDELLEALKDMLDCCDDEFDDYSDYEYTGFSRDFSSTQLSLENSGASLIPAYKKPPLIIRWEGLDTKRQQLNVFCQPFEVTNSYIKIDEYEYPSIFVCSRIFGHGLGSQGTVLFTMDVKHRPGVYVAPERVIGSANRDVFDHSCKVLICKSTFELTEYGKTYIYRGNEKISKAYFSPLTFYSYYAQVPISDFLLLADTFKPGTEIADGLEGLEKALKTARKMQSR